MQFLPEILLLCLLLFLYCLFVFAKEDFILLRKNVTLEQLFNISFTGFIVVLFFSRLTFVFEHLSKKYLDPLIFFLFIYFPGLSFAGGSIGGIAYIWYCCKKKKYPFGRIFDITALSFLFSTSIGLFFFFISDLFFMKTKFLFFPGAALLFLLMFISLSIIFMRGLFRDGSIGFLSVSFASLCLLSLNIFSGNIRSIQFTPEEILLGVSFFIFLILFFQNEIMKNVYRKIKK